MDVVGVMILLMDSVVISLPLGVAAAAAQELVCPRLMSVLPYAAGLLAAWVCSDIRDISIVRPCGSE